MEQSEKHFYMIIVSGQTTRFFFLTGSGTPEQAIGGLNP